ncbi:hypothetical protein CBR_g383 [Chara braunii]|uniref:Uncharacterized protein n=1 Tax=Chara braunii TaxID=69332 RepID=A0A388JQR9_CHABU|nr:hypothetical protein CBR_g383 [Chara braunii]|eukprot:GBG60052.1 hypothetical protein CBR_g383 [Chara braunii]
MDVARECCVDVAVTTPSLSVDLPLLVSDFGMEFEVDETFLFNDWADLAWSYEHQKHYVDFILGGHIAKAEEKKANLAKEREGILGRTTRLEETLKKIWEVGKDPEVEEEKAENDRYDRALMGIMGEEEEELRQLLDNQPLPPPPPGGVGQEASRNKSNGFVPIGSAQWLESVMGQQQDRGWVGNGFHNLAPINVKGWKFLADLLKNEVEECRRKALVGTLDYANATPHFGGKLTFPTLSVLDPTKCVFANPVVMQKMIPSSLSLDLRNLRRMGRPIPEVLRVELDPDIFLPWPPAGPTLIKIAKPNIWEAQRSSGQPSIPIDNIAMADILTAMLQITTIAGVLLTVECERVAVGEIRGFGTRSEEGTINCDMRLRGVSGEGAFPGKQTGLLWPVVRATMKDIASSIAATLDYGGDSGGSCFYGFGGLFGPGSDFWGRIVKIGDALYAEPEPDAPGMDGTLAITGGDTTTTRNDGGTAEGSATNPSMGIAYCSRAA